MSTQANDLSVPRAGERAITSADVGLFLLRLGLGVIFFAHGAQKVLGWFGGKGLETVVAGMGATGIPAPLAYLAAFTEFLGGIAIIIGLFSRTAALGLAIIMIVAMAKVHGKNGFFMSEQGIEFNVALLAMALAILLAGPGRIALADLEARFLNRKSGVES